MQPSEDVTQKLLTETGKLYTKAGTAKADKLTATQREIWNRPFPLILGYTSKALLYDDALRAFSAAERQALVGLLKGGLLRIEKRQGSRRHAQPELSLHALPLHTCGADSPYHYAILRA